MKSQNGVTLTILVAYIIVATIIISMIAFMSANFYSNVNILKEQDKYAVEFNKFNMFFINDVKKNKSAQIESKKLIFEDGTTYELKGTDIYRNNDVIANKIQSLNFSEGSYKVPNTNFTKKLINVTLSIGETPKNTSNSKAEEVNKSVKERFNRTIEYVLKYW